MPRTRFAVATAAVAAATLLLSGCAGNTPEDAAGEAGSSDGTFPVTIEHALGETTITEKPERVATVAWANHEVPLALGIVPVGMAKAAWGDDDGDGVLPWVQERLEELDAETPVLFDETDGIDFEAVADTNPDVILASYSGLTQEEYDTLSKIAPVVAFPEIPWATSWEDMTLLNSAALGLAEEGEQLVEDLHAEIDTALAAQPGLADAKVLFSYLDAADLSTVGFYTSHDTRPGFLESLGLPAPAVVTEESEGTDAFYVTVSSEQADRFADVDVFVTYGSADGAIIEQLQADPLLSRIPAIAEGRIAILEDSTPLAASANPSPLSIGWGIDEYFAVLAGALG
ncbi:MULTISPECIES: iron-siderophore ABC transporter substrate-binding protein [unclassified Microbacterium]|uniref:iron-siderophore ABC transporter substrate-binding protein n=1 Tax=unclassified Microbacterium TaxID=2609290 RepID=UPI00214B59F7|nr:MULTISPECIES: iron-siderophore ABC transporter substrate-binding protein [unclassified Microbacterium]MCR2785793.1 iron-siderophore ABC transporter substrate-binding protein [Microbacterium sp. zg.B96]WIM17227.1 iron-siderophore ABC transporter substrate-binding protein [Microbacterium sp. zg-B96]